MFALGRGQLFQLLLKPYQGLAAQGLTSTARLVEKVKRMREVLPTVSATCGAREGTLRFEASCDKQQKLQLHHRMPYRPRAQIFRACGASEASHRPASPLVVYLLLVLPAQLIHFRFHDLQSYRQRFPFSKHWCPVPALRRLYLWWWLDLYVSSVSLFSP